MAVLLVAVNHVVDDAVVVDAAGAVEACLGVETGALLGMPIRSLIVGEPPLLRPFDGGGLSSSDAQVVALRHPDGGTVAAHVHPVSDTESGASRYVVTVIRDLAGPPVDVDRVDRRREQLGHAVLDSLCAHTAVVDGAGFVRVVNPAWRKFWCENAKDPDGEGDAVVGRSYLEVCDLAAVQGGPDAMAARSVGDGLRAVLDGTLSRFHCDYPLIVDATSMQGPPRWFEVEIVPLVGHEGAVVLHTEITARKRTEQLLAHRAVHDGLSGELNRAGITQVLDDLVACGLPFAVLFADLDGFKGVNDSLGHRAGDDLLVAMARRIRGVTGDASLGRFGGDEFAVVLPGADRGTAEAMAADLVRSVRRPLAVWGLSLALSVSVGVLVVDGPVTSDELLRDVDAAMYEAKRLGRDRYVVFDAPLRERAVRKVRMLDRLRAAVLDPDAGGLTLHYQPIVSGKTLRISGVEALARWRDHRLGTVQPQEFIGLAEECGMIAAVGAWALERACRDGAALPAPLVVHVNVSAREIADPGLVSVVREALETSGLSPARLCLEITETSLLDVDAAGAHLAELRALGIRLALDDFGTGWSSLGLLTRLPVDRIKIDRGFVAPLGLDGSTSAAAAAAVVGAVVDLAGDLGLAVTAEGIETRAQLEALQRLRCDDLQGFLVGRPRPLEELQHHLDG